MERGAIRVEAQRIVSIRLNPFSKRAEVRRAATRINAPYELLLAEVVLAEYEHARVMQDAWDAGI
jgi:hypothetical protein